MKKVVRLTESDLIKLVKRVIKEGNQETFGFKLDNKYNITNFKEIFGFDVRRARWNDKSNYLQVHFNKSYPIFTCNFFSLDDLNIAKNFLFRESKKEDLFLYTDKFLFDNNVLIDTLFKNISKMSKYTS